jgi:hypothetical protein
MDLDTTLDMGPPVLDLPVVCTEEARGSCTNCREEIELSGKEYQGRARSGRASTNVPFAATTRRVLAQCRVRL